MSRLRFRGRGMPVPRHGCHVTGSGRGTGPRAAAQCTGSIGRAVVARARATFRHCVDATARTEDPVGQHPDDARGGERHAGTCGVRRFDEPAPAHSRHRARGRSCAADRGGLDSREPLHAPTRGCAAQWPAWASDGAGVHGGWRSGGDAAPAPHGAAAWRRHHGDRRYTRQDTRLVGVKRPPARGTSTTRCRCGSVARCRDHEPGCGKEGRAHEHRRLSGGQHCA